MVAWSDRNDSILLCKFFEEKLRGQSLTFDRYYRGTMGLACECGLGHEGRSGKKSHAQSAVTGARDGLGRDRFIGCALTYLRTVVFAFARKGDVKDGEFLVVSQDCCSVSSHQYSLSIPCVVEAGYSWPSYSPTNGQQVATDPSLVYGATVQWTASDTPLINGHVSVGGPSGYTGMIMSYPGYVVDTTNHKGDFTGSATFFPKLATNDEFTIEYRANTVSPGLPPITVQSTITVTSESK
jgi:hypothetical protein